MPERLIVSTLQSVERWQEFKELPLHMTLMPWFSVEQDKIDELSRYLTTISNKLPPLHIVGEKEDQFGASGTIQVRRVAGELIRRTHFDILAALSWTNAKYDSPYVASKYSPHVTYLNGEGVNEGETHVLGGMQVFEKINGKNICKVTDIFHFNGNNYNRFGKSNESSSR